MAALLLHSSVCLQINECVRKVPCSMHLLWCCAFTQLLEAMLCNDNVNAI